MRHRKTRPSPSEIAERMPKWRSQSRRTLLQPSLCSPCDTLPWLFAERWSNTQLLRIKKIFTVYSIIRILHDFDKQISPYISRFALWHLWHNPILLVILLNVISNYSRGIFLIFQHYVSIFIVLFNSYLNKRW